MCQSKINGGHRCGISEEQRAQATIRRRRLRTIAHIKESSLQDIKDSQWIGIANVLNTDNEIIRRAIITAFYAHKGVIRVSGEPYINHPLRCARRLQYGGFNHEAVTVAILHDAIEDSELTLKDLKKLGFNDRIVTGVDSVTKRPGEVYLEAVARAAAHPLGRLVKLADNLDNSSPEQLAPLTPERQIRARIKYEEARVILHDSIKNILTEELHFPTFNESYRISNIPVSLKDIFDF